MSLLLATTRRRAQAARQTRPCERMARAERPTGTRAGAGRRPARSAAPIDLPQAPPKPAQDVRARLVPAHGRPAAGPRVLVVGDAMLDHYWSGAVERISPEA